MLNNFIKKEKKAFDTFDKNGKRLIITNILYSMVFPFIVIFSTAFVNRATGNQVMAIINGFGFSIGLIFGNYTNGMLLRKNISIRYIYSAGMLLSIAATFIMMMLVKGTIGYSIIFFGLFTGYGSGLYWSGRQYLAYLVTKEENRNFYAGIEQFTVIFFNAVIPFVFGTIIIKFGRKTGWYDEMLAYQGMAAFMVIMIIYAVVLVLKSSFQSPAIKRFTYWRFSNIWNMHRVFVVLVGIMSSGIMFFIPLLILNVAGDETVLGKIEISMAVISVIVIYILGRTSQVKHRSKLMMAGAVIMMLGGTVLSFTIDNNEMILSVLKISFLGVLFMKASQLIAEPLIIMSYSATCLSNIGKVSKIENRDSYTYVFDNEITMNLGRIIGGLVFIAINFWVSPIGALQFIFVILGATQIVSSILAKKLTAVKVKNTKEF